MNPCIRAIRGKKFRLARAPGVDLAGHRSTHC